MSVHHILQPINMVQARIMKSSLWTATKTRFL